MFFLAPWCHLPALCERAAPLNIGAQPGSDSQEVGSILVLVNFLFFFLYLLLLLLLYFHLIKAFIKSVLLVILIIIISIAVKDEILGTTFTGAGTGGGNKLVTYLSK